jgi:asparagine synthase (glutamine-hydrolysing)
MCGIAGYFCFDGQQANQDTLSRMGAKIAHRGPDGEGCWHVGPIGFIHRRLAIIDLSQLAAQPMLSADKRYVITFNGEIYNYRELRKELELLGHAFRTKSDTEVLLVAWSEWGVASLPRLNGMFAFAIFDCKTMELHLCRDRYGIKPLYFSSSEKVLIFGSEAKAILEHGAINASPDLEALLEYFTFQNLFTDRTLFAGIHLLPHGSYMKVTVDGKTSVTRWWDYSFREPAKSLRREEYVEELDRLFSQAVRRQLVSDVSVASYLSGGIDSGAIAAVASRELSHMRTFTVGFDSYSASGLELQMDERRPAEHMSYLFGTEHYEMVLKAGDMVRCLPQMAWHIEEPRVGQSYPNFYAAQLVSRFDKVVLAGTGGDELFGGYPWRYYRAVVNDDFEHYIDKYYEQWNRLMPNKTIKKAFGPVWQSVEHVWTRDIFRNVFGHRSEEISCPEDYINHSLYFEAKTFLHGLLVVEDKLSMAHGLETRLPFLDNDLVDFAMNVPASFKLGNLGKVIGLNENQPGPKTEKYFERTRDGKLLLREAMSRYVPQEIIERTKQGFSAPDASWFRGESIDYVKNSILKRSARLYEFLDYDVIKVLVDDHLTGKTNRRLLIWSLLSFEKWLETFQ